jgi:hypothetical protein
MGSLSRVQANVCIPLLYARVDVNACAQVDRELETGEYFLNAEQKKLKQKEAKKYVRTRACACRGRQGG